MARIQGVPCRSCAPSARGNRLSPILRQRRPERIRPAKGSGLRARVREGRVSDALVAALGELGVELAFGVVGGGVAPIAESFDRLASVVHCRHETGAAFAATEASLVSRRPCAVFATTGPGVMNALAGPWAARWEGAHVVLVSGSTSAAHRGRCAFQETSALTRGGAGLGDAAHFTYELGDVRELDMVVRRLAAGFSRPAGFVAHLSVPTALQTEPCPAARIAPLFVTPPGPGHRRAVSTRPWPTSRSRSPCGSATARATRRGRSGSSSRGRARRCCPRRAARACSPSRTRCFSA